MLPDLRVHWQTYGGYKKAQQCDQHYLLKLTQIFALTHDFYMKEQMLYKIKRQFA
jgi:hypothetical protein